MWVGDNQTEQHRLYDQQITFSIFLDVFSDGNWNTTVVEPKLPVAVMSVRPLQGDLLDGFLFMLP